MKKTYFFLFLIWIFLSTYLLFAQRATVDITSKIPGVKATLSYNISGGEWGYNAEFTINNTGSKAIEAWILEFDWSRDIDPASIWSAKFQKRNGNHYKISYSTEWNSNIAPGGSHKFGFNGTGGDSSALPTGFQISDSAGLQLPPNLPPDQLAIVYRTVSETSSDFAGEFIIANPNKHYLWNGNFFAVFSIQFETTAKITMVKIIGGSIKSWNQKDNIVSIDLGWKNLFPLDTSVELNIEGTKNTASMLPHNFKANYVRGNNIVYPEYGDLPASWEPGKINLTAADLIQNSQVYYDSTAKPVKGDFILYHPSNATQIQLGQVMKVNYPVNTNDNVRIWIPCKLMAMGLGIAYEFFKINPNYMAALGTKENFTAGIVPASSGSSGLPVIIDGEQWNWPIQSHPDGPYQQEVGNFKDAAKYFADFFPDSALHIPDTTLHRNYVSIKIYPDHPKTVDPNWVSSAISSAISITVTRETFNAVNANYNHFIENAADSWAEMATTTFAYNRGAGNFFSKEILSLHRQKALTSPDIIEAFNMGGFADHVPTVKAIVEAMNKALDDIYDAQITWAEIEIFFDQLRTFYPREVPSATEWSSMIADVHRAFDVLAKHWQSNTISYRYDFLTLLRVAKKHLPKPYIPRPTGQDWYYLIRNINTQYFNDSITTTIAGNNHQKIPQKFVLDQNYPNPFNPATTIRFSLPASNKQVELNIYSITGQRIKTFPLGAMKQGEHFLQWRGKNNQGNPVASGVYIYQLKIGKEILTKKMLLIK